MPVASPSPWVAVPAIKPFRLSFDAVLIGALIALWAVSIGLGWSGHSGVPVDDPLTIVAGP